MEERALTQALTKETLVLNRGPLNLNTPQKGIIVANLNAKWNPSSEEMTLSNISLEVRRGQLVAIIGTVGAAKVIYNLIPNYMQFVY